MGEEAPWAKPDWPGRSATKAVMFFNFLIGGLFYGLSPLILPVSEAFVENDGELAGGIFFYGFAVLTLACNVASVYCCFYNVHSPLRTQKRFVTCALVAWPLALVSLAAAVQVRSVVMLFALAFPLMGFSIGVEVAYLHLVQISLWWGDKVNIGHAWTGTTSALGALVWTLLIGEAVDRLDTIQALWGLAGVHAAATLVGLLFLNPAHYLHEPSGERAGEATAEPATPLRELLRDWRLYVFLFVMDGFWFAGISMKTLLSVLFEELFDMNYLEAVRYSAACLSLYVVARAVVPLMAGGSNVFKVFLVVLVGEMAAYALTPWAVQLEGHGMAMYTSFRLMGGAGFAILAATTSVLLVRVFGVANVPRVSGLFLALEWIGGLGPSVAFLLHVEAMGGGSERAESWYPFFYLCSAVAALCALGTLALWLSDARGPAASTPDSRKPEVST